MTAAAASPLAYGSLRSGGGILTMGTKPWRRNRNPSGERNSGGCDLRSMSSRIEFHCLQLPRCVVQRAESFSSTQKTPILRDFSAGAIFSTHARCLGVSGKAIAARTSLSLGGCEITAEALWKALATWLSTCVSLNGFPKRGVVFFELVWPFAST